ncbi:MAG: TonB-dependent receptor [Filimonas sp.]|nr:TonB-dependent receptor [Filimonas sp.]
MKKWFLFSLFVCLCGVMYAQDGGMAKGNGKITGKVLDKVANTPLEYATISVQEEGSGKTVTGTTSAKDGAFLVTGIAAGSYKLVIEFIGYQQSEIKSVVVKKNETVDVKTIQLQKAQESLSTVTVTAQAKLVENKIDKMVFNAEKDLTSVGGVATDILRKVPQVSVDVDGNVQLAGNSSIRFLVNGKPSTAFGSSVADVLQSIPASQIKSIEVITNPGAKYDAQGLGGIINIILKTNTAKGINGNLSLTAGSRMENGSFNFNARNKNFGFNAFVSGNARLKVATPYSSTRNSVDTAAKVNDLLSQGGTTELARHGIESGMGFDWTYKKYNSFSGAINYNTFGSNSNGLINQTQQLSDYSGNVLSRVMSLNNTDNSNRFHNVDMSLNYKRTFAKEGQELEFSVNSSLGRSTGNASNEQRIYPKDSLYYGIQSRNPGRQNETQLALDYTQPLAEKVILGTGVKTTFVDITSTSDVLGYNPAGKQYVYDNSLSTNLQYHQKVYAGYAELTFPVGNWFDVKAGTRYERTEISSYYANAQQNVKTPGYNTLVPSIFLSKKIGEGQVIKLSYAKRIERPDYGDLNPFINTSDPKNITAGNPYLKPELGQRVELSYSKDFGHVGSVMLTAFFRHNAQDIQPYVQYYSSLQVGDSTYYNVSVSSRENIGTENNTGANIFADLHITSKFGVRTNVFLFHRHIINTIDAGGDRTSFNYRMNLNATYQFSNLLAAEFFGNFNSARNEVQGKYPSITTYSFAVRKMFWNKKASLALTATNPFNEYVTQRTELYGPNFTTYTTRKIPFRSVGINFTWKFGLLEFKKEREMNNGGDNL